MDKIGAILQKSFTFVWEVKNFSNTCFKVGEFIESPFFTAGEIPSNIIKWQLVFYPSGKRDCSFEDYASLFLVCILSENISECSVSCKFYLWNSEIQTTTTKCTKIFNRENFRSGFLEFVNKEKLQTHVFSSENDSLRITCCLENILFENKLNNRTELIESLDTLFLSDCFSDVTIEIDNKHLKAHKNILATRSEIFSAMFKHNTTESIENVIRITDISYEVMLEVLRFIYCGKVENLQIYKEDLLAAANKYNLISLKTICEVSIWNNVNHSNVCEILILSELYQCYALRNKTIAFIAKRLKQVINSLGFKKLTDSNPKLLADILQKVAE